jgi:hypothetical protein
MGGADNRRLMITAGQATHLLDHECIVSSWSLTVKDQTAVLLNRFGNNASARLPITYRKNVKDVWPV